MCRPTCSLVRTASTVPEVIVAHVLFGNAGHVAKASRGAGPRGHRGIVSLRSVSVFSLHPSQCTPSRCSTLRVSHDLQRPGSVGLGV